MSSATVQFKGFTAQSKDGKWLCGRPGIAKMLEIASKGFTPHVGDFNPDYARAQAVCELLNDGKVISSTPVKVRQDIII